MRSLLAHLVGDYLVQSNWMANAKTSEHAPAVLHGASYAAAFLPLTRDPRALLVIGGTHAVIDRYRLAKYVVWARNQVAPAEHRYPLAEAGPFGQRGRRDTSGLLSEVLGENMRMGLWRTPTEVTYPAAAAEIEERSQKIAAEVHRREATAPIVYDADWLHGWLLFIADNTMHLLINEWALARWRR